MAEPWMNKAIPWMMWRRSKRAWMNCGERNDDRRIGFPRSECQPECAGRCAPSYRVRCDSAPADHASQDVHALRIFRIDPVSVLLPVLPHCRSSRRIDAVSRKGLRPARLLRHFDLTYNSSHNYRAVGAPYDSPCFSWQTRAPCPHGAMDVTDLALSLGDRRHCFLAAVP